MDASTFSIIFIVGALIGLVLLLIWKPDAEVLDVQSLKSKQLSASISLFVTPQRECLMIDDAFLKKYPAIKEGIKLVAEDANGEIVGDRYISAYGIDLSFDAASSIISRMPFEHSVTKYGAYMFEDETHTFRCTLRYNDRFYDLTIEFRGFIPPVGSNYSLVRITKEEGTFGRVVLQPVNATVWLSFNSTVVWKNELSQSITLVSEGSSGVPGFDEAANSSNVILPGKIWYFYFRPDLTRYTDEVFRYRIEPYDLEGVVFLKIYPRCMTQEIVRSLYSQTNLDVKFPAYLPERYVYQCGFHVLGTSVILTYWNKDWHTDYDTENVTQLASFDAIAKDVIEIRVNKELQYRDKEKVAEEHYQSIVGARFTNAALLMINGNPVVAQNDLIFLNGKKTPISVVWLYADQETYVFRGKVVVEELVKMAESLYQNARSDDATQQYRPLGRDPGPFYIWIDETTMTGKKGEVIDFLDMDKGASKIVIVNVHSVLKTKLPLEIFATIGRANEDPKMPLGVIAKIENHDIVLEPDQTIQIPIHITIAPSAPDGTYTFKVYGKWIDMAKGTMFHLVVGEGSAELNPQ